MSFAVARGLRDDNPVRGVKKPPVRSMERFLSEVEIARLGEALDAEAKATGDPYPTAAIRLLLFTGCRRSEILGLRWEWVDFERAMIFLPDSKTGRKPVYLNAPALEVLEKLPRQLDNPYVVCGHRDGGAYAGLHEVWRRVRTAAALQDVRLHDLRHSYASIGAAGNNSLLVLGKLLGHRHAATTERYAHLSADPMRQAAEAIGQRIKTALPPQRSGDRLIGDGPPFVKIGAAIRYPLSELEKWLAERTQRSTSETGAPVSRRRRKTRAPAEPHQNSAP